MDCGRAALLGIFSADTLRAPSRTIARSFRGWMREWEEEMALPGHGDQADPLVAAGIFARRRPWRSVEMTH